MAATRTLPDNRMRFECNFCGGDIGAIYAFGRRELPPGVALIGSALYHTDCWDAKQLLNKVESVEVFREDAQEEPQKQHLWGGGPVNKVLADLRAARKRILGDA